MDKAYQPSKHEKNIYDFWEKKQVFKAKVDKNKSPFCIILPPPNANADLHIGHAMYVYEDVMIRYHKFQGREILWLPGADHAGFETQFVFEHHLKKQGKSRFDYDRDTLFKMIWDFVAENRGSMEQQLRRLGFALDWSKEKFTMDEDIVAIVYRTFKKLHDKKLLYRDTRLVNYCVRDGTSFSDLEVEYVEKKTPLYYMKYGPFTLATTRPETKFGDTAVAVHPKDKRYKEWIGKTIEVQGLNGPFKIKVISDSFVDPKFGTGVVKVTPAHDFNDFEAGKRHDLPMKQVIGYDGKLNEKAGKYKGLFVSKARTIVADDLKKAGLLVKVDEEYVNRVGVCYKCKTPIEPLPLEQWFIKIRPLADEAKKLVQKNTIAIYPSRFKKVLTDWLESFHDWNISRQIVWGIRIPAYKCMNSSSKLKMQNKWFVSIEKPKKCEICGECKFEQDSDTFDTWFSSAQWPFATLMTQGSDALNYFYPTSVMETGYDILPWWVARMIMIGNFATGKPPFETVFLHGLVRDKKGQKMSKSKGNVINPMDIVDKYGADALRAALLFGTKEGNNVAFSEEKVIGMRNFANKIWNIGRFIHIDRSQNSKLKSQNYNSKVKSLEKEFEEQKTKYHAHMKKYEFSSALGLLYEFLWHRFADYYIEQLKEELKNGNMRAQEILEEVYLESLRMLHPFMPFITEAIYRIFNKKEQSILEN